jgi:hypothetical protein
MIIDKIKYILEQYQDANLTSQTSREIIATVIYGEIKDMLDKHNERGL